jgi:hypothetical protein
MPLRWHTIGAADVVSQDQIRRAVAVDVGATDLPRQVWDRRRLWPPEERRVIENTVDVGAGRGVSQHQVWMRVAIEVGCCDDLGQV